MELNLKWQQRFITIALEIAKWSKDPSTQVGAVIVSPEKRIISTGYNGLPAGMNDDLLLTEDREWKIKRIIHAEMNALANAQVSVKGCTMFVTRPPCNDCAKHIAAFGIKNVVFLYDESIANRWDYSVSEEIFKDAGIQFLALRHSSKFP